MPYGNYLHAANYDVIIFTGFDTYEFEPGGDGAATTRRLIYEFNQPGKLVAAICRGQQVLAEHGELAGKRVAFCKYVDSAKYGQSKSDGTGNVAADGQIVTAAAAEDAWDFVAKIVEKLDSK